MNASDFYVNHIDQKSFRLSTSTMSFSPSEARILRLISNRSRLNFNLFETPAPWVFAPQFSRLFQLPYLRTSGALYALLHHTQAPSLTFYDNQKITHN